MSWMTRTRASGLPEALLDEVAHQSLRSLLVFHQHVMGSVDLVPLQSVQEGDTHHSRCKEQRSHQGRVRHLP